MCIRDRKNVWIGSATGTPRVQNVKIYDKASGSYLPLDPDILPKDCTAVLGTTKSARITTMINSILRNSDGNVRVGTCLLYTSCTPAVSPS